MEKKKWKSKLLKNTKEKRMLAHQKKEARKELMEDAVSEEELGEKQENSTERCGKEIETCENSEAGKQQKSEQNEEESGQMIKDMKQYEKYDRKDNNSGVSRNKSNENESNIHKKPKGIIQTAYHISKIKKESSDKEGGSADERETYRMKRKGTNRQDEKKYDNFSQNDSQSQSKLTKRLTTRSINKETNKPGDELLTAQNLPDLEQKTNKTQNVMRDICQICDKYVETGVQCGYCQRCFHFKCENNTEEQVSKEHPAEQQYVKTTQKNKFQKNTQQNNNTHACKTNVKSLKAFCSFSVGRRRKK